MLITRGEDRTDGAWPVIYLPPICPVQHTRQDDPAGFNLHLTFCPCAQAYRKRVLETHPDKAPVKTAATADAFAELQAAYTLIRDEDVRKNFDLQMRIGRYTTGGAAAGVRYAEGTPLLQWSRHQIILMMGATETSHNLRPAVTATRPTDVRDVV